MSENTESPISAEQPGVENQVNTLVQSFVRFSTAITVFGMQQVQTAVESRDPQGSFKQLHQLVDSLTGALSSQLDDSRKATLESVSGISAEVVSKTLSSLNPANLNPQDLMQATGDIIKRTSSSLSNLVSPVASSPNAGPGEPVSAGDVLTSHA